MKTSRAWFSYVAIRLLAIIVPFALVMLLFPNQPWNWVIGIVVGTVVGFAVSIIFLRSERFAIGDAILRQREGADRTRHEIEEDALLDAHAAAGDGNRASDASDDADPAGASERSA